MPDITVVRPTTWQAQRAEALRLFAEAKRLAESPDATAEQRATIPAMMADAQEYKAAALRLQELEGHLAELKTSALAEAEATPAAAASKFQTWGEFLFKAWEAAHPNRRGPVDQRLVYFRDDEPAAPGQLKDMSGSSAAAGGALIPTEFQATLMAAMAESSIARSRATVIPMRRRQLDIPVLDQTATASGYPHWFGGLRMYWQDEGSAKQNSDPTFRLMSLIAHKLIGLTRAPDELLDDSAVALDAFLSGPMGFAGGAAWMEDYAFLRGTGAGQPVGVINAPATISVTRATAGTVGFDDLANMLAAFLPSGRGVWAISQSLMADLVTMSGPSGNASYLWTGAFQPGGVANRPSGTLLGYPVIWTEKLPSAGYSGDIALIDWNYYVIGDRQATTIESTKFEKWAEDKTSWRMVHRIDGQPWLSAPLTYEDGVTQVSPFVKLTGTEAS